MQLEEIMYALLLTICEEQFIHIRNQVFEKFGLDEMVQDFFIRNWRKWGIYFLITYNNWSIKEIEFIPSQKSITRPTPVVISVIKKPPTGKSHFFSTYRYRVSRYL